jgi:hypothetical protein
MATLSDKYDEELHVAVARLGEFKGGDGLDHHDE